MLVVGLTGSIGMGKTTAANAFRREGVPVHDADAAVHDLLGPGGEASDAVRREFPDVVRDGQIDRAALGAEVFNDQDGLARLEGILHPLVRKRERAFLAQAARRGARMAVLDIPLLFETGAEARCDAVVVVCAPARVQAQRVLTRPGMTRDRLEAIRARQMSDVEKCRRADFVVRTGLGRSHALQQIHRIVKVLRNWRGLRWQPIVRRRCPRPLPFTATARRFNCA